MKKAVFLLLLLLATTAFAGGQKEIKITGNYTRPGDGKTWGNALGMEGQFIFWICPQVGVAPSLGVGTWSINDQYAEVADGISSRVGLNQAPGPGGEGTYWNEELNIVLAMSDMEGNATTFPIGLSILLRSQILEGVGLLFEGGIRYVLVSSNVDASVLVTDSVDAVLLSDAVEIASGIIGCTGALISFETGGSSAIYLGAGYQFDISKGDATWFDEDFGDNELKGFQIMAGVGFSF